MPRSNHEDVDALPSDKKWDVLNEYDKSYMDEHWTEAEMRERISPYWYGHPLTIETQLYLMAKLARLDAGKKEP